jgi:DNA-binding transcriptional regulator LsrR (DeoR family)
MPTHQPDPDISMQLDGAMTHATPEFDQTLVRVAWLYFKEGKTQGEIADLLMTNRLRINKLINEARTTGLVTFTLHSQLASCIEAEQMLCEEFGLERAVIVPSPGDPDQVAGLVGQAAAAYFNQLLAAMPIRGAGTGWGITLREMVRAMPASKNPGLCISSVLGGLTSGIAINTFDIASDLARQLGAECAYLAAPVYVESKSARDAIMGQQSFQRMFERISRNDLVFVSIGDLTDRSLLMRYGLPHDVTLRSLLDAGAVGDILGQFIDRDGKPVEHEINSRVIGLSLAALADVPRVVVTAGGLTKTAAIAGALRSGLATTLVCDEDTARAAMKLSRQWGALPPSPRRAPVARGTGDSAG